MNDILDTVALPAEAPRAFAVRRHHFTDDIHFYAPGLKRYETSEFAQARPQAFVPISLTGGHCALRCDHCRGQLLESMRKVERQGDLVRLCHRLKEGGTIGVLLSGGSNGSGCVPLLPWLAEVAEVRRRVGLQVLVHTGLVDSHLAQGLGAAGVDGALIDIIGAEETIRRVYHLDAGVADFERSLSLLVEHGVSTVPHIVLGLHYGRLVGEERALEIVAHYPTLALVLVVLTPLAATPMATVAPPPLAEVAVFFHRARCRMRRTPLMLGCARPGGPYKEALDRLAVDCGFNGVAYPAEGVIHYARSKGLVPRFHETCCALAPVDHGEANS